jgi:hypothetical protein
MSAADDRAGEIFDALVAAPNGMTKTELCAQLSYTNKQFVDGIRAARLVLADNDTVFILADPDTRYRGTWRYRLVGGATLVDAEQSGWTANRIGDAQSRVQLLAKAMAVAKRATKPGTVLGRKAREMERVLRHLVEDLDAIDAEI